MRADADANNSNNVLGHPSRHYKPAGDNKVASKLDPKLVEQAMRTVQEKPKHDDPPSLAEFHTPPPSFQRGQPLTIVAHAPKFAGARLRYRRVNQAETWQMVEMELAEKNYRAVIPAAYTDSPFPLQYHFQIRTSDSALRTPHSAICFLYPGLQPGWQGQPYFVVRQG